MVYFLPIETADTGIRMTSQTKTVLKLVEVVFNEYDYYMSNQQDS